MGNTPGYQQQEGETEEEGTTHLKLPSNDLMGSG
jgi:hypothetical protein